MKDISLEIAHLAGRLEQLEQVIHDARGNLHGWEYQRDQVSLKLKQRRAQERTEDANERQES